MVLISKSISESITLAEQLEQQSPAWVVSGKQPAGDFQEPLEDSVRDLIKNKWNLTSIEMSTNPPYDFDKKIRLGDWDYDNFSTYYIKIKEGKTIIDNSLIGNALLGFQTPIVIDMFARRLSKSENFQELEFIRKEMLAIIGQYKPDEISGVDNILIKNPAKDIGGIKPGKSVWHAQITAQLIYFKHAF